MNFQIQDIKDTHERLFALDHKKIFPDTTDIDYWNWDTPEGQEKQKNHIDFTVYTTHGTFDVDVKGGTCVTAWNRITFEIDQCNSSGKQLSAWLFNSKSQYVCYFDDRTKQWYLVPLDVIPEIFDQYTKGKFNYKYFYYGYNNDSKLPRLWKGQKDNVSKIFAIDVEFLLLWCAGQMKIR